MELANSNYIETLGLVVQILLELVMGGLIITAAIISRKFAPLWVMILFITTATIKTLGMIPNWHFVLVSFNQTLNERQFNNFYRAFATIDLINDLVFAIGFLVFIMLCARYFKQVDSSLKHSFYERTVMSDFSVGYSKRMGFIFLGLGLVPLTLNLWVMLLDGGFRLGVLTGAIVMVVGVLYLTRDFLRVSSSSVEQLNMLGMTLKSYPISQLEVENEQVYVVSEGKRKKLATRWLARDSHWQKLLEHLQHQ